jgi:hypothetical protein
MGAALIGGHRELGGHGVGDELLAGQKKSASQGAGAATAGDAQ